MVPDMITSAKGLTSAYAPLSATILSEQIYEVLSVPQAKGAMFTHGYTYSGHPVCCAAGLKNIEIMEREDICGHVRRDRALLRRAAAHACGPAARRRCPRQPFHAVRRKCREQGDARNCCRPKSRVGKRIADACQKRGVLVRPLGHLNILSPPLILTSSEIDRLVEVVREAIIEVADGLAAEGHGCRDQGRFRNSAERTL